jgi:hypothetical protein
VESPFGQLLADFPLVLSRLQLLEDMAGRISDFTYILSHDGIDGPPKRTSSSKFSISPERGTQT